MNESEVVEIWNRAKQGVCRYEFSEEWKARNFVDDMMGMGGRPKACKCWYEINAFGKVVAYVKRRGITNQFKVEWMG